MEKIQNIEIGKINQITNSRLSIGDEEIKDLMVSMKHNGLLQPIGVSEHGKGYQVIFGNRRLTAAKKLGWSTIECIVFELTKGEEKTDLIVKNVTENISRLNPSLYEQGRTYQELVKLGLTIGEIASRVGSDETTVRDTVACYNSQVSPAIKKRVLAAKAPARGGYIGASTFKTINHISKSERLSAAQTERLLKEAAEGQLPGHKVRVLGKLMGAYKLTPEQAKKRIDELVVITLTVPVDLKKTRALEAKTKKTINRLMMNVLEKEFPVVKMKTNFPNGRKLRPDQRLAN